MAGSQLQAVHQAYEVEHLELQEALKARREAVSATPALVLYLDMGVSARK